MKLTNKQKRLALDVALVVICIILIYAAKQIIIAL